MTPALAPRNAVETTGEWFTSRLGSHEALEPSSDSSAGVASASIKHNLPTGMLFNRPTFWTLGGLSARVEMLMQATPALLGWQQVQLTHINVSGPTAAIIVERPPVSPWTVPGSVAPAAVPALLEVPSTEAAGADTVTADVQVADIIDHLSLKISHLAEILEVARPTVYAYRNGTVLVPKEGRPTTRLRGLHALALEWKQMASVPLGPLASLRIDEDVPSLLDQLMARDWDVARLRNSLRVLAAAQEDRAERRRAREERGFGRGRETDPEDRELRRVDDAIRRIR